MRELPQLTFSSYNHVTNSGFQYDAAGNMTHDASHSYTYDAASNRTGYTAPDGSTNTYSYDTLNRLSTLVNSWAGSFGFSYDALSRRTQMTRPNGVATNYSYDNLSHLLSVLHQLSASTIDGATYTVDNAGNRTAKTDNRAGVTSNYTYDAIYELTQATQGGSTTESYTYDPVGNRLSSLGVSSYTNNSSNELTATSNASYTYDYNGNTTSKTDSTGTTSYLWDFENRLTSVTLPGTGGTVTFKYDPFGRRIEKVSASSTSIWAYDGDKVIETTSGAGAIISKYAEGQGIDEPLGESSAGATSYYEQDGLGSVTSLTNSAAALAGTYNYDSFGKLTASSGSVTNPFEYTARDFDAETSLYYYRARYYDPTIGRFLNEDPLGFSGGVNFYPYVGQDPVEYADPFGEIRYNKPPPKTVPVTGQTLADLKCLEHCLQCVTNNPNLNLLITGGAEQFGHKGLSFHYIGQAVDISFYNPVTTHDVFQCGEECGFTAGQSEPAALHWHLQLTPGNGVPLLPPLLPMKPPCPDCKQ